MRVGDPANEDPEGDLSVEVEVVVVVEVGVGAGVVRDPLQVAYDDGESRGLRSGWWGGFACGILTALLGLVLSHLVVR